MDAKANAQKLDRIARDPSPAQIHRYEAMTPPVKTRKDRNLIHPLDRERAHMLMAERDAFVGMYLRQI